MQKSILLDKYPVFSVTINKNEAKHSKVDEIFEFLKGKIEVHPVCTFIAVFDHLSHTKSLADQKIAEGIKDAKNIIFCFGKEIPNPLILAVRPRSIAVCEFDDRFVISFLQVPNENLQTVVESWIDELKI